jgi:membrane protease YdiL (CAAX protease family)
MRVLLFLLVCVYLPVVHAALGAVLPVSIPTVGFSVDLLVEWSLFALLRPLLRVEGLGYGDIGLRRDRWLAEAVIGVVIVVLFWLSVWCVLKIQELAGSTGVPALPLPAVPVPRFFEALPEWDGRIAMVLLAAVTSGVCEETIFRGYLLGRGRTLLPWRRAGLPFALFFSSVFFGLLHLGAGRWLFTVSTFGGFCCSLLVLWRGNLTSAIVVHTLFNLKGLYVSG